jgi:MFS family permease
MSLLAGGLLLGEFARHGGLVLPLVGRLPPWRSLFVAVAAPGFVLAVLLALLVREPRRRTGDGTAGDRTSLMAAIGKTRALLVPIVLGTTVMMSVNFALAAWAPTFFIRRFGLAPQAVGAMLGPTVIACSLAGSLASGVIAGLARPERALRGALRIVVVGALLLAPSAALFPLAPSVPTAAALFAAAIFALSLMSAMATVPIQLLAPPTVRAQMIAVGGFLLAVIAAGGGPFEVGFVTDRLFRDEHKVGLSLAAVCLADVVVGLALVSLAFRALPAHEAAQ